MRLPTSWAWARQRCDFEIKTYGFRNVKELIESYQRYKMLRLADGEGMQDSISQASTDSKPRPCR